MKRDLPIKRHTQTDSARTSISAELRSKVADAERIVSEWARGVACDRYRRERARFWAIALRAVERAK